MRLHAHGGSCCGIKHLYGFDNETINVLDQRIREFDSEGGGRRLLEVVLSERQVRGEAVPGRNNHNVAEEVRNAGGWPAVLAQRGFRLVSRFNNSNSNQNCYVFHRMPSAQDFLSMENDNLPFNWNNQNTAPVNIPPTNFAEPVAFTTNNQAAVGRRVQYIGVGQRQGRIAEVIAHVPPDRWNERGERLRVRFDGEDEVRVLAVTSFRPAPVAPPVPPAPAPEPAPRIVYSAYSAHFRRNGRSQKRFDTLAEARTSAPRCQQFDRFDVYSDGRTEWVENINE